VLTVPVATRVAEFARGRNSLGGGLCTLMLFVHSWWPRTTCGWAHCVSSTASRGHWRRMRWVADPGAHRHPHRSFLSLCAPGCSCTQSAAALVDTGGGAWLARVLRGGGVQPKGRRVRRCRGVVRRCRGVVRRCRGVVRRCRGVVRRCRGVVRWPVRAAVPRFGWPVTVSLARGRWWTESVGSFPLARPGRACHACSHERGHALLN
jgi:hypothetical protein